MDVLTLYSLILIPHKTAFITTASITIVMFAYTFETDEFSRRD